MAVYIEPFICTNLLMNITILYLCQRCCGLNIRWKRTLFSAFIGCIYALISCIYEHAWISGFPSKILCAGIMTAQIIPIRSRTQYSRICAAFCLCTFLLGGMGFGLFFMMGRGGFGLFPAVLCCVFSSFLIYFLLGQKKHLCKEGNMEKLIVFSDGQKHEMNALIDSGNLLTEPISALPVIVCTDLTLIHFLHSTSLTLPYCGAGGTGLYKLYKPDAIYICKNSALERVGDAYIAFDTKIVKNSDFDLIVPLTLFH